MEAKVEAERVKAEEERVAIEVRWAKISVAQALDEFGRDDLCSWVSLRIDL